MNSDTINIVLSILGFTFGGGFLLFLAKSIFRLGEFHNQFKNIEEKIDEIRGKLKEHWNEFREIRGDINSLQLALAKQEQGRSPLVPTPDAMKHLRASGLVKMINETEKENLLRRLKRALPSHHDYTEYDVQQLARRVMVSLEDNPLMVGVKKYAFENGLDAVLLLMTSGLLLRDIFLEEEYPKKPRL